MMIVRAARDVLQIARSIIEFISVEVMNLKPLLGMALEKHWRLGDEHSADNVFH